MIIHKVTVEKTIGVKVASPTQSDFGHLVGSRGTGVPQGITTPFDSEPDIYSFQFLGQSGRFTMALIKMLLS